MWSDLGGPHGAGVCLPKQGPLWAALPCPWEEQNWLQKLPQSRSSPQGHRVPRSPLLARLSAGGESGSPVFIKPTIKPYL